MKLPDGKRIKSLYNPQAWRERAAYVREYGMKEYVGKVKKKLSEETNPAVAYTKWLGLKRSEYEKNSACEIKNIPLISVCIALGAQKAGRLHAAMASLFSQSYPNWELCVAGNARREDMRSLLSARWENRRIRYRRLNGCRHSEELNVLLDMAAGKYILLLGDGAILEKDALRCMAETISEYPETELVYTDSDMTKNGRIFQNPSFKPDFNLFMLECENYIGNSFLVRRECLIKAGGFRGKSMSVPEWDLLLRLGEAGKIRHIPRVLIHGRDSQGASGGKSEQAAEEKLMLETHFRSMGLKARVSQTAFKGIFRPRIQLKKEPRVSIIICNKDERDSLKLCVDSILNKTAYENYEIIIVENNSTEEETFMYYKELEQQSDRVRVVYYEGEFNFSKVNNYGAGFADGEYLVLLNNDTEVISRDWLGRMTGFCSRTGVGAVGVKLLYPDETVQHCGVVIGIGGFAGHVLIQSKRKEKGYMGRLAAVQECSAVTAACMMLRKTSFDAVGGLSEDFRVALNDIDLCLKIREKGEKIVLDPGTKLYHFESKSRGAEDTQEKHERFKSEIKRFREKWKAVLEDGDPYYNPNLSLENCFCTLRAEGEKFPMVEEIEGEGNIENKAESEKFM